MKTLHRLLKRRFYGDRVIMIAWSRFNSYGRRTCCCVLGWGVLQWLSLFGGFEAEDSSKI